MILSLIFLAHALRQNRKQSELANWRDLLGSLGTFKGLTNDLESSEFSEHTETGYHALTPAEQQRRTGLLVRDVGLCRRSM